MLLHRTPHRLALGTLALALAIPATSFAQQQQNRQTSDAIFTEQRGSMTPQLLGVVGDIIAWNLIKHIPPKSTVVPEAQALSEANERIAKAIAADISPETKIVRIREAESDLARARLDALRYVQMEGLTPKLIRSAKVIGQTLVLVDLAGRVWVWQSLHANPTWSPAWQMLAHVADGLSTSNALPVK